VGVTGRKRTQIKTREISNSFLQQYKIFKKKCNSDNDKKRSKVPWRAKSKNKKNDFSKQKNRSWNGDYPEETTTKAECI